MSDTNIETVNVAAASNVVNADGVTGTNAAAAKESIKFMDFDRVYKGYDKKRNPRLASRYTPKELNWLARNIFVHGLLEALVVSERADGSVHGLKGHLRSEAIYIVRTTGVPADKASGQPAIPADPNFMDKVKVRVLKGLTLQEEIDILMDHGTVTPLNNQEKYRAAKTMRMMGFSQAFVADKIGQSRSNFSNGLDRIMTMPGCVEEAFLAEGEAKKGQPEMTQETLKVLYEAYQADQKAPGSRIKVAGPKFTAAWEEVVKNGGAKKPKSLSRDEIRQRAGMETDADIREMLEAIANGNAQELGQAIERVKIRLQMSAGNFSTIDTDVVTIEEGIATTVRDYEPVVS